MENLKKRTDIVILNADKGGAVVIQDVKDYINEANKQLSNKTFYQKTDRDLTHLHNKQINDTVTEFQRSNVLTNKVANMLKTDDPRTPKFYTIPKIHEPNNLGRPVISSIDCHTSKISEYVDVHLKEIMFKSFHRTLKTRKIFLTKQKT